MLLAALLFCTSQTLLRSSGPMAAATLDRGVVYYQLVGERAIRTPDSVVYTSNATLSEWSVENGVLAVRLTPADVLLIGPGGARRTIAAPSAIVSFSLAGDFLYWIESDRRLRRAAVSGGATETTGIVVPSGASYALFEDRAVWASAEGVYWQPLSGGAPILLLARGDVGLSSVTREFVYLSSKTPFDPNVSTAQIFRVPWSGGSARTVYEETLTGYTPSLSLGAIVRGATTYILRTETQHFFWTTSTLLALRGGVARRRLSAPNAPFHVLAADEEAITVGHWVDAGGMRAIERVCAAAPKTRAVSR